MIIAICLLSLSSLLWSVYGLYRNEKVYQYRKDCLAQIAAAVLHDLRTNSDWEWRYDYFSKVSYYQMLAQFWRSLDSFYPDKSFISLSNAVS